MCSRMENLTNVSQLFGLWVIVTIQTIDVRMENSKKSLADMCLCVVVWSGTILFRHKTFFKLNYFIYKMESF